MKTIETIETIQNMYSQVKLLLWMLIQLGNGVLKHTGSQTLAHKQVFTALKGQEGWNYPHI